VKVINEIPKFIGEESRLVVLVFGNELKELLGDIF
jgi:hypothetical protein